MLELPKSKDSDTPSSVDPSTVTKILDASFKDDCLEFVSFNFFCSKHQNTYLSTGNGRMVKALGLELGGPEDFR